MQRPPGNLSPNQRLFAYLSSAASHARKTNRKSAVSAHRLKYRCKHLPASHVGAPQAPPPPPQVDTLPLHCPLCSVATRTRVNGHSLEQKRMPLASSSSSSTSSSASTSSLSLGSSSSSYPSPARASSQEQTVCACNSNRECPTKGAQLSSNTCSGRASLLDSYGKFVCRAALFVHVSYPTRPQWHMFGRMLCKWAHHLLWVPPNSQRLHSKYLPLARRQERSLIYSHSANQAVRDRCVQTTTNSPSGCSGGFGRRFEAKVRPQKCKCPTALTWPIELSFAHLANRVQVLMAPPVERARRMACPRAAPILLVGRFSISLSLKVRIKSLSIFGFWLPSVSP